MNKPTKMMTQFWKLALISLAMFGCQGNADKGNTTGATAEVNPSEVSEFLLTGLYAENDTTLLRVVILGDAEPKPLAEFPNMAAAVEQVNALAQTMPIDFAIGIGDIAHKGTEIQYEAATAVLQKLTVPFYPIMGNEEHGSTVERYLHYV